jgi:thiol-disulfide isomerase/thioredoxin
MLPYGMTEGNLEAIPTSSDVWSYFLNYCDGKFAGEVLNDLDNAFSSTYFDLQSADARNGLYDYPWLYRCNRKETMRQLCICLSLLLALCPVRAWTEPAIGDMPPDVELGVTSAGKSVKPGDYLGRVVVVTFWASWCGPCRKELPILESVQEQGKGQIQVIAVNIEDPSVFRKAARILKDQQMQLANDRNGVAQRAYHVKGIPHMMLIGRDGRILDVHEGYAEAAIPGIVDEINQALATKTLATGDGR